MVSEQRHQQKYQSQYDAMLSADWYRCGIDTVVTFTNLRDWLHQPLHLLWCVTSCPNTRDLAHSEQYQGCEYVCICVKERLRNHNVIR